MNYSRYQELVAGDRVERRLAAILVADVAGYSRLMHADEEATHARVTALLTNTVMPAIAEHGGRVVKNTGDGLLAEFPSAVEAVRAAMAVSGRRLSSSRSKMRRTGAFCFASESISATSSSARTTSSATASTSRRGSRASPSPAAFACRRRPTIRSTARSASGSPISASKA